MRKILLRVAAVATMLVPIAAFGHARLLTTAPADGAQLVVAPTTLTLTFAEAVKLAAIEVATAGHTVPITVDRAAKAAATVVLSLPTLAPGRYEVRWSAISPGDGHISKGSLTFTVQPATH